MKINEIVAKNTKELPGYKLLGHAEVGIPIFQRKVHVLSLTQRQLPVTEEFLLSFYAKDIKIEDIKSILGIESSIVDDAWRALLQNDYINYLTKKITDAGHNYLRENKVDKLEKMEFSISIDGLTGEINKGNNNLIVTRVIKEKGIRTLRALILRPEISKLEFSNVKRVFEQYKKSDSESYKGHILDIVHMEGNTTKFKKINILVFQNPDNEVRIMTYDGFYKIENYEDKLFELEKRGESILKYQFDNFFESKQVRSINAIIDNNKGNEIEWSEINKKIESYLCDKEIDLVIPLVSECYISEGFLDNIYNLTSTGSRIRIILSGRDFLNEYQKKVCNKLIKRTNKDPNLSVIQIPQFFNEMIISKSRKGVIVLKYMQNEINLPISKIGNIEVFYEVIGEDFNKINQLVNELADCRQSVLIYDFYKNSEELLIQIKKIYKLVIDIDTYMKDIDSIGWLESFGIPESAQFINVPIAETDEKFKTFMNSINKSLVESLEFNAKTNGKPKYFWNEFKNTYPELQYILEKIKVYRNRCNHLVLDDNNKSKYNQFLVEDLNGYMPEFLENGFLILQYKLLIDLEIAVVNTLTKLKE